MVYDIKNFLVYQTMKATAVQSVRNSVSLSRPESRWSPPIGRPPGRMLVGCDPQCQIRRVSSAFRWRQHCWTAGVRFGRKCKVWRHSAGVKGCFTRNGTEMTATDHLEKETETNASGLS
jgi:hypothetical protein